MIEVDATDNKVLVSGALNDPKFLPVTDSESCNTKEVSIAFGRNSTTGAITCACSCDGSDPGKDLIRDQLIKNCQLSIV